MSNKFNKNNKADNVEIDDEIIIEPVSKITTYGSLFGKKEEPIPEDKLVEVTPIIVGEEEPKEKTYRVHMKEKFKSSIGGKWYYLEKGMHYNVSAEIKDILIRENVLRPL